MPIIKFLTYLRESYFRILQTGNMKVMEFLGYPENEGMPNIPIKDLGWITRRKELLPMHDVPYPPVGLPFTYREVIFGSVPRVQEIPRTFYHSAETGFYSFYIENFRNVIFLPDELSEFLQIRLGYCLDISFLETVRQGVFMGIVFYGMLVYFRSSLYWFCELNPFDGLIYYLVAVCDWFEDSFGGYIPNFFGVNMSLTVFQYLIGKCGDSFNHLVFTMPYLPGEGEPRKLLIDGKLQRIIDFRYLPRLWYEYPIPNEIRQYWLLERPDILTYMQKSYSKLDINFLPDAVLKYAKENPQLKIESIPFQSLPSKLASLLHDLAYVGSPSELLAPDPDDLMDIVEIFHNILNSI